MSSFNKLNGDYEVNYVLQVHLGDAIWSQTLIRELSNGLTFKLNMNLRTASANVKTATSQ